MAKMAKQEDHDLNFLHRPIIIKVLREQLSVKRLEEECKRFSTTKNIKKESQRGKEGGAETSNLHYRVGNPWTGGCLSLQGFPQEMRGPNPTSSSVSSNGKQASRTPGFEDQQGLQIGEPKGVWTERLYLVCIHITYIYALGPREEAGQLKETWAAIVILF